MGAKQKAEAKKELAAKRRQLTQAERRIDISYDLVGILPASLLNDLQNGETA